MINIPKGTKDVLPSESYKWHFVENKIRELTRKFCVNEIRTPTFEHTELFLRGVGDGTDIVGKEMYTFLDKGERSITLKPEGTAGVARAFIENALDNTPLPVKMYYFSPVFRYERPQAGRLREHHQFGVEFYGSDDAFIDAEVIMLASELLYELNIPVTLNINSIGCPECRKKYNEALKAYLKSNLSNMCKDCNERFDKNPLRILDCKNERCKEINQNAPKIIEYLCDDCRKHFEKLQGVLNDNNVKFNINPYIVRGLDYYTKTVFEFIAEIGGDKLTVCGGGRYNNLVESIGGKPMPAVGFGMGLERLLILAEQVGSISGTPNVPYIYIAPMGEDAKYEAFEIVRKLRAAGVSADTDYMDRSIKSQMKYADKLGVRLMVVIGDDEMKKGEVTIKDMQTKETKTVAIESLVNCVAR